MDGQIHLHRNASESFLHFETPLLSCSASSPVYPINSGKRHSAGVVDFEGAASVRRAVFVGVVGARMVKEGVMEAQEIFVKEAQNVVEKGFGLQVTAHCEPDQRKTQM